MEPVPLTLSEPHPTHTHKHTHAHRWMSMDATGRPLAEAEFISQGLTPSAEPQQVCFYLHQVISAPPAELRSRRHDSYDN